MIGALLLGLAWGADCPQPAYSTDLAQAISDAEVTFSELDIPAFKEATDRIRTQLPCLDDPVTRQVAASVHRYLGIRAFADRRPDDAVLMFRGARALEPGYAFPDSLIPPGNPIRTAFDEVDFTEVTYEPTPPPADGGYLQLDGRATNQRPMTWAVVYQRFDAAGALQETAYLMPSDPIPAYQVRVGDWDPPIPYVDPVIVDKKPVALLGATVAAGVTTGVLYGLAGVYHGKFADLSTPDAELDAAARNANALSIASAITGTATLGLGVGVALRW